MAKKPSGEHMEHCISRGSMNPNDRAARIKQAEDHMDSHATHAERKPKIIKEHSADVHKGGIYKD